MDQEFGTKFQTMAENKKSVESRLDLNVKNVNNQIIVNAEITSFDNFVDEIKERGKNLEYRFSQFDVERFYNLLCFKEIENQEDEEEKYNPQS